MRMNDGGRGWKREANNQPLCPMQDPLEGAWEAKVSHPPHTQESATPNLKLTEYTTP